MSVQTTIDKIPALMAGLAFLVQRRILVGIPAANGARREAGMTNAALGYIHEHGSPARHIPARPFLAPGIASVRDKIAAGLGKAGELALAANALGAERAMNGVGLMVQNAIRGKITDGIPPPLADRTLRGRIRNRTSIKGAKAELASRAAGNAPGIDLAKPLIATGQLRNSITYVIRSRITGRDIQVGPGGS